jgi:GT2 family glycosyltransferase
MPAATPAAVSIIVVNFNGGEKLRACLQAMLATAGEAEIVVVDNASTDGSAELAGLRAPRIRVIRNRVNAGYAAGLNQGAGASSGEILVFANMDTVPEPGWLEPLASALRENPRIAAVNPLLLLMDGVSVNAAGQRIHVTGLGFNRGLGEPAGRFGDRMFAVDGIHGAFFAMRRSTFERIGGLDTTGFLYHEDVNGSWLLRLAGYELCCVPASRVRHDYFLSMHADKFHLLERNRAAMLMAYLRPGTLLVLLPVLLFTELLAWGYAILRRHGFGGAKWRSYGWVIAHREQIRERRRLAATLRRVGDLRLLAGFSWAYDWRQFGILARERGLGRRKRGAGVVSP